MDGFVIDFLLRAIKDHTGVNDDTIVCLNVSCHFPLLKNYVAILKHTEHGFATHMFSAPHDQVSVYRVAL